MAKTKELTGTKFGRWGVLGFDGYDVKTRFSHWVCVCDCGTTQSVPGHLLTSSKSRSCGCLRRDFPPNTLDVTKYIGKKYNSLTILRCDGYHKQSKKSRNYRKVICRCDCGTERSMFLSNVIHGKSKTCGKGSCVGLLKDIRGKIYNGYFRVIEYSHSDSDKSAMSWWYVECIKCGDVFRIRKGNLYKKTVCICTPITDHRRSKTGATKESSILRLNYKSLRNGAKKRSIKFELSYEDYCDIAQRVCYYCGDMGTRKNHNREDILETMPLNSVDRYNNKKGYHLSNCVPSCNRCNYWKGKLSAKEFLSHVAKIKSYSSI